MTIAQSNISAQHLLRFTPAEKGLLERAAKKEKLSVNAFARRELELAATRVLGAKGSRKPAVPAADKVTEVPSAQVTSGSNVA